MLQFAKNSKFQRISRFPENSWNFWKTGILKFWAQNPFQWLKLSGNDTQYVGIGPKLQILENFQISRKFLERFQKYMNFEILTSKSISVTKIEWKWYPMCWNWPKTAISWELPDFRKISGKISGQLEFWNSELKIKFSDKNWVGKIPNTLKLVKISQFQAISRFPDFQIPDSRKSQMSPKVCKIIVNMLYWLFLQISSTKPSILVN